MCVICVCASLCVSVCLCVLGDLVLLQSVFRRLLFPALVAPAMTTWTPLRSRSPLLSSFRCCSISACRSHTDLSTVWVRGWGVAGRLGLRLKTEDMTKVSRSTSLSWPCKRNFCPLKEKGLSSGVWHPSSGWKMVHGPVSFRMGLKQKNAFDNSMHRQYTIFFLKKRQYKNLYWLKYIN